MYLLHEFLYYIGVHRSWIAQILNNTEVLQKMALDDTRARIEP
jgi:hypothetical protein